MKRSVSIALASALIAGMVAGHSAAQDHPWGYAAGVINFSKTTVEATVIIYDTAGNITSSVAAGSNNTHGLCMDHNNRLLVATDLTWGSSTPSIHKIDPMTGTNVGTLATFPTGNSLRDIAVGQNGNYYVTESVTDTVFQVDQAGTITTVAVVGNNPWGGIDIDIDSSELFVHCTLGVDPLLLLNRDGSSLSTIATGFDARYGFALDIATGDIYSSSGDLPLRVYQLLSNSSAPNSLMLSTLANGGPSALYSMRADRASSPFRQVIAGSCGLSCPNQTGGLYTMDISGLTPVITGVITTMVPSSSDIYDVEVLYRRNVHSNATGKGTWDIGIKIPEDANKGYVLAVSATGVRGPGAVTFPQSGRTAWLVADAVTFFGLGTGLAPFLVGDKGNLDANGEAIAKLNMSFFPPSANGIRLWFLAVTIDPNAPDGIATITDPHIIKLEGL